MPLQDLSYWTFKTPIDNKWHPQPGQCPTQYTKNLPPILQRTDIEATLVDVAPFIASVGAFRHASQLFDFGFTVSANVFRNVKTMTALHRSTLVAIPLVLSLQAAGVEYRNLIPRWSTERERYRQEDEVRRHVDVGAYLGALSWVVRMFMRVGLRYWAPIDVVLGGAGADKICSSGMRYGQRIDARSAPAKGQNLEVSGLQVAACPTDDKGYFTRWFHDTLNTGLQ